MKLHLGGNCFNPSGSGNTVGQVFPLLPENLHYTIHYAFCWANMRYFSNKIS